MNNIKAVILDVDGVIVGDRPDYNMPFPSGRVTKVLKELNKKDVRVILCTGKYYKAIIEVIKRSELDNLHIGDNGAVIFSPFEDKYKIADSITQGDLENIQKVLDFESNYFEFYTPDGVYYIGGLRPDYVESHEKIMNVKMIEVSDFDELKEKEFFKLIYIDEEKAKHDSLLGIPELTFKQTTHPFLKNGIITLITNKHTSKGNAVLSVLEEYGIDPEDTLGVGDSKSDWSFIQYCGVKGVMGNSDRDLLELVKNNRGIVGEHVNDDGIIGIFEILKLL